MGAIRIAVVLVGAALFVAEVAQAATAQVTASADSFVSAANPNNNYGSAGGLEISAVGSSNGEFQTLIRFDASAALAGFNATFGAGNWALQSATLALTPTAPNNVIFNANAPGSFAVRWMQNDGWLEGTGTPQAPALAGITYNTLSSFLGPSDVALGSFSYDGASSGAFTYNLALDPALVSDISAGGSVSLRLSAADSAVSYIANSRNFGTASSRPQLVLSAAAVPEPGMLSLLVLGPLLLGNSRRGSRAGCLAP